MKNKSKKTEPAQDWTTSMFAWFGYFMPLEERLAAIRDAGFDEVMLSWEDETAPVRIPKERFPELAARHHLGITNVHAPYMGYSRIWEKPPAENRAYLDRLIGYVADCARFAVPAIVVHTVDFELGPYVFDNGRAFFSELADAGEKYGVDIAVENVTRQFLLKELLDAIDAQHFGLCYDVSHDYMLPCGRGRILKDYGSRLKALHFSDNDGHLDRHWIPGEGFLPLPDVMAQLDAVGWHVLSCELIAAHFWQDRNPWDFCLAAHDQVNRLIADFKQNPSRIRRRKNAKK